MQVRDLRKGLGPVSPQNGAAGHDLVVPAGEQLQHGCSFSFTVGLSQDLSPADHNGIRGNDDIPLLPGHSQSLLPADPGHLLSGRLLGVHGFVNIRYSNYKRYVEQRKQFLTPG